jgi:hypothetical protein
VKQMGICKKISSNGVVKKELRETWGYLING